MIPTLIVVGLSLMALLGTLVILTYLIVRKHSGIPMSENTSMETIPDIKKIPMQQMTGAMRDDIEGLVRSGKPAVLTMHGRPVVALVPLTGRLEDVPSELFGPSRVPPHILQAIR